MIPRFTSKTKGRALTARPLEFGELPITNAGDRYEK